MEEIRGKWSGRGSEPGQEPPRPPPGVQTSAHGPWGAAKDSETRECHGPPYTVYINNSGLQMRGAFQDKWLETATGHGLIKTVPTAAVMAQMEGASAE